MLGFLTRHDLTTALATVEARLTTVEARAASSVARAEELHELTSRLIKRYEMRQQRAEREDCVDCPEDEMSPITERIMRRRGKRNGLSQ